MMLYVDCKNIGSLPTPSITRSPNTNTSDLQYLKGALHYFCERKTDMRLRQPVLMPSPYPLNTPMNPDTTWKENPEQQSGVSPVKDWSTCDTYSHCSGSSITE